MSKKEETKQGISIENNKKERSDSNYLGSKISFKKKLQIVIYSILRGINPHNQKIFIFCRNNKSMEKNIHGGIF